MNNIKLNNPFYGNSHRVKIVKIIEDNGFDYLDYINTGMVNDIYVITFLVCKNGIEYKIDYNYLFLRVIEDNGLVISIRSCFRGFNTEPCKEGIKDYIIGTKSGTRIIDTKCDLEIEYDKEIERFINVLNNLENEYNKFQEETELINY